MVWLNRGGAQKVRKEVHKKCVSLSFSHLMILILHVLPWEHSRGTLMAIMAQFVNAQSNAIALGESKKYSGIKK